MGTTYRFLATVDEAWTVLAWFRELPEQPVESVREDGVLFYFRDFGAGNTNEEDMGSVERDHRTIAVRIDADGTSCQLCKQLSFQLRVRRMAI